MSPQTRLERYELRTEWPLVGVAQSLATDRADTTGK